MPQSNETEIYDRLKQLQGLRVDGLEFTCKHIPGLTPNENRRHRHELIVYREERVVARARWRFDADYLEVIEVMVELEFRRQGICTIVYNTLRQVTVLKLKWIRTALASDAMREFVKKYCEEHTVEDDDGVVVILARYQA